MARKVKVTPVLTGKDAVRFERAIKTNSTRKVAADSYKRAVATYNSVCKTTPQRTASK